MINIDINKFKSITLEDCINNFTDSVMDSYIKRIVGDVVSTGKRNHKFIDMDDDDKINYLLKYCLIQIVPSKKWNEYAADKDNASEDLYIFLKRHFFLSSGCFPE